MNKADFSIDVNEGVNELLTHALIKPINEFFQHPGKNIRSRLVEIGYRLALPLEPSGVDHEIGKRLEKASKIVEMIHGGSLIVDDIQDGSTIRRNIQCMHLKYGVPLALNAGNWLYFWAMDQVKTLGLPKEISGILLEDISSLMMKAHLGQALDLGTKVDTLPQSQVEHTAMTCMELKTGSLMAIALRLGVAIANRHEKVNEILKLGLEFGIILQMFDDFANFFHRKTEGPSKRHEDLYNFRPTWIWGQASTYKEEIYQQFIESVNDLPDENKLSSWVAENKFLMRIQLSSLQRLQSAQSYWSEQWSTSHPQTVNQLNLILKELESAYVS